MSLRFNKSTSKEDFEQIHEYTIDAFSDTPDFAWTLDEIEKEVADGWELEAAYNGEDEIVAALFYMDTGEVLLTKNTGLKIHHQGSGYSHQVKEHFETVAREKKLDAIAHYCRIDNFRMYSLNESHGYKKTETKIGDGQVVEWVKKLK